MSGEFDYRKALEDCLKFVQPSPKFSMTSMDGTTTWYMDSYMTQDQINAYSQGWEDYKNEIRRKLEELIND